MRHIQTCLFVLCMAATLLMTGCGDDGLAPFANAGPDQSVQLGDVVTLDGTASHDEDEGDTLSFTWSITSAPEGSTATLTTPNAATTTVTPDMEGEYTFQLTVNDGTWADTDTVVVTVVPQGVPTSGTVSVLVIHSIDTIHGWQVGETLTNAANIVSTEYPSLVDAWKAGTLDATVIEVDVTDAYHPERFEVIDWTVQKI